MKLGNCALIAVWSSLPSFLVWRTGNAPKEFEGMTSAQIKIPGLDYPLITATIASRLVVSVAGRVIADCRETLTPREAKYPAVQHIPHTDIDMSPLERTDHATYKKPNCVHRDGRPLWRIDL